METTLGRCVALSQLAAERFQAIENVPQNGSLGDKILPSNVNQNGSLVQLSDAEAAERFQAIENVPKNGSLGDKILPSNESQVRPLTQLSDAAPGSAPGRARSGF